MWGGKLMKSLGKFLVVAGIALIVLGVAGYVLLSSSGYSADTVDLAIGISNTFGAQGSMDSESRTILWLVQYRTTFLIAGAASFIVGFAMRKMVKE
jgi:hypothetical protein